jgi:arginine/lysine/ornithine decarboxylase
MKNKIAIVLLLLILISCNKKAEQKVEKVNKPEEISQDDVVTMNTMTTDYDTLIHRIKNMGDRDSYDELFYAFMEYPFEYKTDSIMFYSKIMAEKYNYERAYFDYFKALCEKYDIQENYKDFSKIDLSKMDKVSKKQAEDWLKLMLNRKVITQENFNSVKR